MEHVQHEELVRSLRSADALRNYCNDADALAVSWRARMLGAVLVGFGDLVYGTKPSYEKFKAIEVIARIPYQSWEAVAYTLLTRFYSDEARAIKLSKILPFARLAQDNETMHVVVISQLTHKHCRESFVRHTFIPLTFSFGYYWLVWLISMFDRSVAFELNYLFEDHAFHQYSRFIEEHEHELRASPLKSTFLEFYGRTAHTEYDFFESVRIDELIHRNSSALVVKALQEKSLM